LVEHYGDEELALVTCLVAQGTLIAAEELGLQGFFTD
jgi:hypothetical protein